MALLALAGPAVFAASAVLDFGLGVRVAPLAPGVAAAAGGWWLVTSDRTSPRGVRWAVGIAAAAAIAGLAVQLPAAAARTALAAFGLTILALGGQRAIVSRPSIDWLPGTMLPTPPIARARWRQIGPALIGAVVGALTLAIWFLPVPVVGAAALAATAALVVAIWRAGARPSARGVAAGAAVSALALVPFRGLGALSLGLGAIGLSDVAIATAIAVWVAGRGRSEGATIPRYALGLGAFLGWLAIAGALAFDAGPALKELAKWAEITLAVVILSDVLLAERWRRALVALVAAAVVVEALIGLAQTLAGAGPFGFVIGGVVRAFGTFHQPNPYGGYLGLHAPLALAALIYARPGRRWAVALLWLLIVAAIVASRSRGAWLGLAASTAVVLIAAAPRAPRLARAAGAAAALAAVAAMLVQLTGALRDRIPLEVLRTLEGRLPVADAVRITVHENYAVTERVANWVTGWRMLLDQPLFGVGPGNFDTAFREFHLAPFETELGHAHNVYLNFGAEAGLIGLIAITGLTLWAIWRAGGAVRRARSTGWEWLAVGSLGGLTAFAVHNLVDNLFVSGMGLVFAAFVAIAYGLAGAASHPQRTAALGIA